jgi:aryl-alcohol dehydrogenase-like predicted oxidoreductase
MERRAPLLGRREFLKSCVAATVATGAAVAGNHAAGEPAPAPGQIARRPFGKTGVLLPVLGMGSSPMVARWSLGYGSRPGNIQERAALVRHAYDSGVRYFDTGRTYYDMERVIGQGLTGVHGDCFVATKVTVTDPALVRASVEKSLAELGMDRVDVVQIHSSGAIEKLGFEGSMRIHAQLVKLREEGLFRYIGLTTHVAFETVFKLIATGGFDQALLTVCYFNKGMDTLLSEQNRAFREQCLDKAHELGMAVVAMKVMGASIFGRMSRVVVPDYDPGRRAKLPAAAMRWVLNDERVSLMAIGMGYPEEVAENAATLSSDLTLTDADRELLADYSAKAYQSPRIKAMGVDQPTRDPGETASSAIRQYDRNGDGKLSRGEFPPGRQQDFDTCDGNKDGFASLQELTDVLERRREQ